MSSQAGVSDRAQHLLKKLVELYIKDGQPVGSKTLSLETQLDLSSATIRNVLADLEEKGFLHSPHTSAGRVPTPQGYRLFIDSLLTVKPLNEQILQQFQQKINHNTPKQQLLQSTSKLLSNITHMASVISTPKRDGVVLRHVEFLPLSGNRILVILVLNEQEVQNRIIHTDRQYNASELEQAANFLTAHFAGKDLLSIRSNLLKAMQDDRASMDYMMKTAIDVAEKAFEVDNNEEAYHLEGETNLLKLAQEAGVDQMSSLFEAFTEKQKILQLLDKSIAADGVQIYIGEESGYKVFDNCSVITAPYQKDGDTVGVLGVIGPARMAYDEVIPVVDVTAKLLSQALKE